MFPARGKVVAVMFTPLSCQPRSIKSQMRETTQTRLGKPKMVVPSTLIVRPTSTGDYGFVFALRIWTLAPFNAMWSKTYRQNTIQLVIKDLDPEQWVNTTYVK